MSSICDICSNKCWGIDGYDGSCCSIEGRDFIMGPIRDSVQFVNRLNDKLGRNFQASQVLIDFEEGKNLFPDKASWQDPENFPAMRVDVSKAKLPCIFYNTHAKFCSVHDIRPQTCQDYFCEHLMGEIGMEKKIQDQPSEKPVIDNGTSDPFST